MNPQTKIIKTDEEWRHQLTPIQFYVTREKGTEMPFTGKYWHNKDKGVYRCIGCGQELFVSETKFESGTGWPSFWAPSYAEDILTNVDTSLGMKRIQVLCSRCGAHLGHIFDDGQKPTGLRSCINSAALTFIKEP